MILSPGESPRCSPEDSHSSDRRLLEPEPQRWLSRWNRTQTDYPRELCVHQLFERQVKRTPESVALRCEGHEVTYQELNRRANQLAHTLRQSGVGPEVLVGICLERSIQMVVAILGILKAGGAYLPLDSGSPKDRLAYMLQEAQVRTILTEERLLDRLPATTLQCVFPDNDGAVQDVTWDHDPDSGVTPANLAYAIYTSGSTGRPKGVMIPHRGVVNYLSWCVPAYGVAAGRGTPMHARLGFDLSVTALYPPLLVGHSVTLVPEGDGIEALGAVLRAGHEFSLVKITPAHLALLSHWLRPEEAAERTRALVIGGEALSWEDLAFWREHAPATRLINEYGPTETVVGCCVYEASTAAGKSGPVPIGRPIANTQLYVLDSQWQPVPMGAAGELYIGGDGVGRGYLNGPELTAERFIPDPFGPVAGARLYRTRDRVRYLPDGNLEFLGRIDHQVKLRGFRIELTEIEAALEQHPRVREAVVLVREDAPGDQRLVAYVVAGEEPAPTAGELRSFLTEKLPDYMLPNALVMLDSLPLTENGKVDREALPTPDPGRRELGQALVRPRTARERQLVEVWEKVLRIRPIGVTDDFFDLGGHSVLAVRLAAQIGQVLGRDLPLRILFRASTVEQLAAVLDDEGRAESLTALMPIQPGGTRPPFFCISVMSGGVNYYRHLARHLGQDQPLYALDPVHSPEPNRRRGARFSSHTRFKDTAALYVREIRALQPDGPYYLGGHSLGGIVAFEVAQQLREQGQKVALLALFEPYYPHWRMARPYARKSGYYLSQLTRAGTEEKLIHLGKLALTVRERGSRILQRSLPGLIHLLPGPARNVWRMRRAEEREVEASWKYQMRPYPGRVELFWSTDRPIDWYCGVFAEWQRIAVGGLEIHQVPGDHISMVEEPHIRALAEKLRTCLHQAQAQR